MTQALVREAVRIDLDVSLAGRPATVAARCIAPDPEAAGRLAAPVWLYCSHGAGGNWTYWMAEFDGFPAGTYNAARTFASRGFGIVAIDAAGTGDSAFDGATDDLTLEAIADAHHDAARAVHERLADGTLLEGVAALPDVVLAGLGFSAGGGLTIMQQGRHKSFELIGSFGINVGELGGYRDPSGVVAQVQVDERGMLVLPASRGRFPNFLDDVPDAIVDAKVRDPFPPSFPALTDGQTLVPFAGQVECPVLLGYGDLDLARDPIGEGRFFERSGDVTVTILPQSAHYHNFSTRRHELWTLTANWVESRAQLLQARR